MINEHVNALSPSQSDSDASEIQQLSVLVKIPVHRTSTVTTRAQANGTHFIIYVDFNLNTYLRMQIRNITAKKVHAQSSIVCQGKACAAPRLPPVR
jgi:hypothetical protein